MISTKERILIEALTLFSEKGFDSVSVAQIAEAVGIKAPSLYKHYKSKQDILEAIVNTMQKRYEEQSASMNMNGVFAEQDKELFINITEDGLIAMGKQLFLYFLHDDYQSKFRKMLTIEQFHDRALAERYKKQYYDDAISYQSTIFNLLVQHSVLIEENPMIIALQFYAPLHLLITLCDCDPQQEKEALKILELHIQQFNRLYRKPKV